jgi:SAM-dependent methyltransferase
VSDHDPNAYGAAIGAEWDSLYPESHDALQTEDTLAMLISLAGPGGRVLEFGVGTGRVALGLANRGLHVSGIEGSAAMLEQLRAKPGALAIEVALGDFVSTRVAGTFDVVAITLNAIFAPGDRAAQLACFANAAAHLRPGASLVVEAYILRGDQLSGSWSIWPRSVGADQVELQIARYDLATNRVERTLVHLRPSGVYLNEVKDSYAWPSELDLMAQMAGFVLERRDGGWAREEFSAASTRHVSVYRLKGDGSA